MSAVPACASAETRPARKTLLSVNNYYYRRGGAEVAFLDHNRLLCEQGWRVVPFCMKHARNLPTPWASFFTEEIELGSPEPFRDRLRKSLKAVYSTEARDNLNRVLDLVAPDICHAHNVYHHLSPAVLGAIRARGIPLVMTLHDLKLACPAYSMLTHDGVCERCRGGRYYQALVHRCMKGSVALSAWVMLESYVHRVLGSYEGNVDRFVVPSRFFLRKFREWGFPPEQFTYVPNFVDTKTLRPQLAPGARFVYLGRLSAEKGLRTLLAAVARAGVAIDLIGAGPLRDELEAFAVKLGADARFRGFLSGDTLRSAVRGARALVLPSECYENAPLSVIEAAALGKPAIVSSLGGLPELVAEGETGWTFTAGSVSELAERLCHVRDLPDARLAAFGARARDLAALRFSPQRYTEAMAGVYAGLGVDWR